MANPFLMTEDELSPQSNDQHSNPFLMEANDEEDDHQFMAQGVCNPFSGFGDDSGVPDSSVVSEMAGFPTNVVPNVLVDSATTIAGNKKKTEDIDSAMSFFGTTITDQDELEDPQASGVSIKKDDLTHVADMMAYSDDDAYENQIPVRPVPPSRTTQDLILSVSDQLDQTSSHMLDRIPVTRTPSPVSMRDLHSPSPTPGFEDLLDIADELTDDMQSQPKFAAMSNDNPFASFAEPELPKAKVEPARPPPPRPIPPRPTPPRRPSPPQVVGAPQRPPARPAPPQSEVDLFDMFGSEAPAEVKKAPGPKSNQDILNLFAVGTAVQTIKADPAPPNADLLCDDILPIDNSLTGLGFGPQATVTAHQKSPSPISSPVLAHHQLPAEHVVETAPKSDTYIGGTHEVITTTKSSPSAEYDDNTTIDEYAIAAAITPEPTTVDAALTPIADAEPDATLSIADEAAPYADTGDEQMDTTVDLVLATPSPSGNPFASPEEHSEDYPHPTQASVSVTVAEEVLSFEAAVPAAPKADLFDAFAAKFDSVKKDEPNLLDGFGPPSRSVSAEFAWGDESNVAGESAGFGGEEDGFDSFLSMGPAIVERSDSRNSDDETAKEFNVVIKPREGLTDLGLATPILAPPPRSSQNNSIYSGDSSPRVNPFDKGDDDAHPAPTAADLPMTLNLSGHQQQLERSESQETPATPLFDEDVSQPLEDFPRVIYAGDGWEMQLRQPNKKKITGQRFWKKIFLRIANAHENPVLQLRNAAADKEPFQELPLQGCYSVSDISAQQFDQFGKIFTLKLQYIFYKERPGVRPGQVSKAGRLTDKLSQFAAYAIQGDYQGVKEFGSDLKKLGLPVEHAPQVSQLFKIGSHNYEDLKQFMVHIDELLFKFNVHRDRALVYKMEEVQVTAVDELYVEQDAEGRVMKQICRVRLFFLGFLSGMPTIELGVNDLWRQGKEVVGRHDIIPVVTEEWIRLEGVEFHSCVQQDEYERSRTIRFQPPDACYIELMRFRVRPPKNRELPFQLKAVWCVTGNKVELRADILVPGFASRKLGQIPCEDVSIRFPIPECWIYLFRVEKHFRYGSVKSAHRRTGKIKGIERILGTVDQLQESLIEVTSGQAKYEHHHRAIVWRCPRLPKEGQGAYTTHQLVVRMALTSYDQIPEQLAPFCYVEFTMPATQVSHMTVRSVSVQDSDSDDPPEKYVRYLARHEYRVGIEHTTGESMNPYLAATSVARKPAPIKEEAPAKPLATVAPSDSDSESN